jgi:hypothetical protein
MTKQSVDQIKVQKWLAIRKKAGRKIDPETAEVDWAYVQDLDPYGINPELPEECRQSGRGYFARSHGSDIWVWFGDLPSATRDALWEKHKATLAFPAGLPQIKDDETVICRDGDGKVVVQLGQSTLQQAAKLAKQSAKRAEQMGLRTTYRIKRSRGCETR